MSLRQLIGGTFLCAALAACGGETDTVYQGTGNSNVAGSEQSGTEEPVDCSNAPPIEPDCPCSRRACAPPSMNCPRGTGEHASASIGPAGGELSLSGEAGVGFSLEIFSDSLATSTRVELVELKTPTPDDFVDWSPMYAVKPLSLEFVNGGAITVPYTVPHRGVGTIPRKITLYGAPSLDGPWEPVADSYNNAGFLQATALGGGYFIAGYPKPADACE